MCPRRAELGGKLRRAAAVGLVLVLALVRAAAAQEETDGSEVELSFGTSAWASTPALFARVTASASLRMERRRAPDGGWVLSLVEPLAPAWKIYLVDPVGPFGDELKLAAEVTLPEPTWEALAEARRRVDALAADEHRRFVNGMAGGPPLDGAFAFIILGPPAGRFRLRISPDGAVTEVENRLTDRWLPGEFGDHIEAWARALREGWPPLEGYWFWNHGEREPFAWEPHVYHALVVAAELLAGPLPMPSAGAGTGTGGLQIGEQRLERFVERTRAVLETLAPRVRLPFRESGSLAVRYELSPRDGSGWQIRGSAREQQGSLHLELERRAEWSPNHGVESDEVIARLLDGRGVLEVKVGYRARGSL